MKNVFVINAFVNSPEKEAVAVETLSQLKKSGYKILLISNSTVREFVVNKENIEGYRTSAELYKLTG